MVDEVQCVTVGVELAFRVEPAFPCFEPVQVSQECVDLSVMPQHPHGLRQRPLRLRVGAVSRPRRKESEG